MPAAPAREDITGLILAGGRGSRMGGVDKGLQPWRGQALVDHAIARLGPQVASLLISANRHRDEYEQRDARVIADANDDFPGPLAGMLAGLRSAHTPWLAVVPCDVPGLPADLVMRLARGLRPPARAAVVERDAGTGPARIEPVCCLLSRELADDLAAYLGAGERKVEPWLARHATPVRFDAPGDSQAFANFNTLADLQA